MDGYGVGVVNLLQSVDMSEILNADELYRIGFYLYDSKNNIVDYFRSPYFRYEGTTKPISLGNVRTWYWYDNTDIHSVARSDSDGDGNIEIVTAESLMATVTLLSYAFGTGKH